MKTYNVLFATNNQLGSEAVLNNLKMSLMKEIASCNVFEVGRFDFVFLRNELNEKIKSGIYDVVICSEELGSEKIGAGSIKLWNAEHPEVKVILLVRDVRKGNIKMIQLVQKVNYYNALYFKDLNGKNVCQLIAEGRTLQEAISYYGIENSEEIREMGVFQDRPKEDAAKEDAQKSLEAAMEAFSDFEQSFEEEFEEKTIIEEFKEEELENVGFSFDNLSSMDEQAESVEASNTETVQEATVVDAEETDSPFAFDLFQNTSSNMEETQDVLEIKEVEDSLNEISQEEKNSLKKSVVGQLSNEDLHFFTTEDARQVKEAAQVIVKNQEKRGELMTTRTRDMILTCRGNIARVLDQDALLLEFFETIDLPQGEGMEDYKYLIRIKSGQKGRFVDGRYRTGNVTFEAYCEGMMGRFSGLMAVPAFDCEENTALIENKTCDIFMTKI